MNIFELQGVTKRYKRKEVFTDISFSIPEHGITCILGKNGAGKTTLIKCLLRLLTFEEGKILYKGQDFKSISEKQYYSKVSAVLEGNRNVYWYMSGLENMLYFGRQKGLSDAVIRKEADRLLPLFELEEAGDQKVGTYSRGMQQKLVIIITLLGKPEVLFLDEPTLGLDFASKNTMIRILRELSKDIPILLTSHQMDVVEELCDHLVLIHEGGLAYEGSFDEFMQARKLNVPFMITVSGDADTLKKNGSIVIDESEAGIHTFSFLPTDDYSLGKLLVELQEEKLAVLNIEKSQVPFEDIISTFLSGE